MAGQRVLIIQDASQELRFSAVQWAAQSFSLKSGDKITIFGVLHQKKSLRYRFRSTFEAKQKIADLSAARKWEEYENNLEASRLSNLYARHKIELKLEVVSGESPKHKALEVAINMKATWVILDRKMKKDRNFFLEKLSCGISRMKRDNVIETLRGPKAKATETHMRTMGNSWKNKLTYDEMVAGSPGEDDDLFSIEFSPLKSSAALYLQKQPAIQSTEETATCSRSSTSLSTSDSHSGSRRSNRFIGWKRISGTMSYGEMFN